MLTRLIKTTKYLAAWTGWTILYPFVASEGGQRRLVDMVLQFAKQHPERALAIKSEIEALLQELVESIAEAPAEEAGAPIIASDASGRHAPPKPAIVVEEGPKPPTPPKPPAPRRTGSRDISDLKARLGLGKKS